MCEKQHTIADIVNGAGLPAPVAEHPNDIVYCEDLKDYVNREDAVETADGKFYSEEMEMDDCDECDDVITEDESEENDGFCESCREDREQCCNCNNWDLSEDMRTCSNNDHWCESCHNDHFYYCEGCSDDHPQEDCRSSDAGDIYCDSCYDDNFSSCISCSEEITNDESYGAPDGETYCSDCHCEAWTECEECCSEVSREESHYHNDMTLCDDCVGSSNAGSRPQYRTPRSWSGSDECSELGSMRRFGIELELIECGGYDSWLDQDVWGAKTDGSVSHGMEFVTAPIAGNDGLAAIREFCEHAEDNDFGVDSRCGFHLHCDLTGSRGIQRKSIALAYHYTCELWHDFIDRSRYDTSYSRLNSETRHDYDAYHGSPSGKRKTFWDRKSIMDNDGHPTNSERYVWINWNAYSKFNTVEIRSHHPTCNGEEVTNWVKAHIKFIDFVQNLTVGQITRTFGGNNIKGKQMAEFRHIWDDSGLFDFYNKKYEQRNAHCLV